ncbi:MAG: DEAD/DEAH box helicase, partial [Caulobacterales bacterium]
MTTFSDLGISQPILKALKAEGYEQPTPIQAQAIPHVLEGRDLIALAQTGTGKTAAFALPALDRLAASRRHAGARGCRALVLAPTRELAAQIGDSFRTYGRFLGLSTAVVFGGASMFKQKQALSRGVDILVATPGRLLDHVSQRSVALDKVELLVLDEADHMLDMGFIHDLRRITHILPEQRQSLLFSATMPPAIAELATQFLTDPERVAVAPPSTTASLVEHAVVHVEGGKKQDLLHAMLRDEAVTRAIVFTRTKHGANRVEERLYDAGFAAEAIHGNKSQGQRTRALDAFKRGHARVLVATEIAARGIDVDGVSHVFNFDLPNVPEQYVHRVGRTARAGANGQAISFCAPDERAYLRDIERLTKQSIPVLETDLSLATPQPNERTPRPPVRGRQQRPSGKPPQRAPQKASGEYRPHRRAEYDGREPRASGNGQGDHQRAPRRDYEGRDQQQQRAPVRNHGDQRQHRRAEHDGRDQQRSGPLGQGEHRPHRRAEHDGRDFKPASSGQGARGDMRGPRSSASN